MTTVDITMTGLDSETSLTGILELSWRYPKVEFAVLVGRPTKEGGNNRFPPKDIVDIWKRFAAYNKIPTAVHLCGPYARSTMEDPCPIETLDICEGFDRVQVNSAHYDYDAIDNFADIVACDSVILQHRGPFEKAMPLVRPDVSYLHDLSGGRGIADFQSWPPPVNGQIRHGYAGGISPDNIKEAVAWAQSHTGFDTWVDMESSLRDKNDLFDIETAKSICELADC